jgi:3-dehydroquinate synthase
VNNITIKPGALEKTGEILKPLSKAETLAVVTDKNVGEIYLERVTLSLAQAGYKVLVITMLPGEQTKSIESYFAINNWLAENEITRTDALVALGGGVIGDLTGFVAATYLRGVKYIQIPTSLLAMVDSSVGGKTAIDIPAGKNLVGAFHQPQAVICDPSALSTLPPEVFADGCAEVIKHGMIRSESLLNLLRNAPIQENLPEIIRQNIPIKSPTVAKDEFDTGERQLLNFGHTIGHAIERLGNFEITHGNAVAAGMTIITRAAVRKGFCPPECLSTLEELLKICNLPNSSPFKPHELFEASLTDKKRAGNFITEVIPRAVGDCVLHKIPISELQDWIETGYAP